MTTKPLKTPAEVASDLMIHDREFALLEDPFGRVEAALATALRDYGEQCALAENQAIVRYLERAGEGPSAHDVWNCRHHGKEPGSWTNVTLETLIDTHNKSLKS